MTSFPPNERLPDDDEEITLEDAIPIHVDDSEIIVHVPRRFRVIEGPSAWQGKLGELVRLDAERGEIVLRITGSDDGRGALSYDVRFPIGLVEAENDA